MVSTALGTNRAMCLMLLALLCVSHPAFSQSLPQAQASENVGDFSSAVNQYKKWLTTDQASGAEKRHVKIRLPVVEEAALLGGGEDVNLYLDALAARADKNIALAHTKLQQLLDDHPNSRLRDDSLYLKAYILLMDEFDYRQSAATLASLRAEFPDSEYYDTALYSQAIAEEQQGNMVTTISLLSELRERHTAFSIGLINFALPKDKLTSRYWFTRSDKRLDIIKTAQHDAAKIVSKNEINHDSYQWRMVVEAEGEKYTLLLKPSKLLTSTEMTDTVNGAPDNYEIEALEGIVEGEPESWVRLSIEGDSLTGTLSIDGERQPLLAAATDGTLGYYNRLLRSDIDGKAASQHADGLHPPRATNAIDNYLNNIQHHSRKNNSRAKVTHVVRLGVVIDSQYNQYHGGKGFQRALSILNTSDGIFREEFGFALHIENVVVIADKKKDPMNIGNQTMENILRNFQRYRRKTNKLSDDIGIATLFTGNKNSDLPLGLAWIGTACRSDGYDVSVVTPFSNANLLTTHEIAHSMGAPHDSDTPCGESRYLMSRRISRGTKQTFSKCSVQSVKAQLAKSRCHTRTKDGSYE